MNEEKRGDEISLLELFNVLRCYKGLLLGLPLVGAVLAALLVFFVLSPTWQATATLEVGHVGQLGPTAPTLVEPVLNVVTRMMLPSFGKSAIKYAGIPSDEQETMQGFYGTLNVTQIKTAELVEVSLRGPSAEMANKLMQGAIVNLQNVHSEMMAVSIERYQKQLQILTEDIHKSTVETELLRQKLLANHSWNDFDATLAATLLQNKSNDLRDMIQRKLALEELLSPSRSYTTRVVGEIYVSGNPVSPKKPLIFGLAILLGLFGAVVIAFGRNVISAKSTP